MPSERGVEKASGIVRRYVNPSNPAIAHITKREHELIEIVARALDAERAQVWEEWRVRFVRCTTHTTDCPYLRHGLCSCGTHEELAEAHRELNSLLRARAAELRERGK